jgi:putative flippase GtrA
MGRRGERRKSGTAMIWTSHLRRNAASGGLSDAAPGVFRDWRHIADRWPVHSPLREFTRYVAASAFAFVGDFATLVLLTELFGVHYLVSAAAGFGLGILITYCLSIRWVFSARRLANASVERMIFVLIGVGGLAINHMVMFSLTEIALFPYWLSKIGAVALVFLFNFTLRKALLFTASAGVKG